MQPSGEAPQEEGEGLLAALAALRASGAWRLEPVRFRYLEALAERMQGQDASVQALLQASLQAGLADYAERTRRRQQEAQEVAQELIARRPQLAAEARRLQAAADLPGLRRVALRAEVAAAAQPLAQLNASLRATQPPGAATGRGQLASAERFRRAFDQHRSLARVDQALARKPAHAGPLNSHVLVLQALAFMRELSPEYLRQFVSTVETLQWLEQVKEAPGRTEGKARAARAPRRSKKG